MWAQGSSSSPWEPTENAHYWTPPWIIFCGEGAHDLWIQLLLEIPMHASLRTTNKLCAHFMPGFQYTREIRELYLSSKDLQFGVAEQRETYDIMQCFITDVIWCSQKRWIQPLRLGKFLKKRIFSWVSEEETIAWPPGKGKRM